jgi:2-polyprenyl-3-methyl-5-hydroxy-6-metoxy-1,4-benzoquinol methylase
VAPRFDDVSIETVRAYWDTRPCNLRHSPAPVGSREYFAEVEARKYFVEPHIPGFAQFSRWRGKRVLELGCGIGTDTVGFAREGAAVTACDLSPVSLSLARQHAAAMGVDDRISFVEANGENLSEHVAVEPYDLVYAFGVVHHSPRPELVVRELARYLAPGGTLKLMVYHRASTKVLAIRVTEARISRRQLDAAVARRSEAQTGCPVTYTYSRREARELVERADIEVDEMRVEHIFPYRVADYVDYRYTKRWYWRPLPRAVFSALEHRLGWHLLLTGHRAG